MSIEKYINSPDFKKKYPCSGKDVKVMSVRTGRSVDVTVAMAMIDFYVSSTSAYKRLKDEITQDVQEFGSRLYPEITPNITLNALDRYDRGKDGLYLTVTGTSAESGDSGQVGRGNNPAGLISISRPVGVEAASGKNAISHIGKIYNHFCFYLADKIYQNSHQHKINSVYVWMVSRIGTPINKPTVIYVKHDGIRGDKVESDIIELVNHEMEGLGAYSEKLANGIIKSL